jgi:hypothetical protein
MLQLQITLQNLGSHHLKVSPLKVHHRNILDDLTETAEMMYR